MARSSRSSSRACALNGTIDRVNEDWTHCDSTIKIERCGLIAELARRGATRGDIPAVQSSSDKRNERKNVGPCRGSMPYLARAIVVIHPILLRSNGPRFSGRISFKYRCSSL